MTKEERDAFLHWKANQFENPDFIETDPISIPHRYQRKEDIEIIGLLVATIAWGNRKAIIKSGHVLTEILGESPLDFVMNYGNNRKLKFTHRTFCTEDLAAFIKGLKFIYEAMGGLEAVFMPHEQEGIEMGIMKFRQAMLTPNPPLRIRKHLSDPSNNSACKRLNMYLRWMIRSNAKGVDFGIWKSISPSKLHIPLDVHTGNTGRKLGLLERKQNDWKSSKLIHEYCKELDPMDPSKYDFALFGLGAFESF